MKIMVETSHGQTWWENTSTGLMRPVETHLATEEAWKESAEELFSAGWMLEPDCTGPTADGRTECLVSYETECIQNLREFAECCYNTALQHVSSCTRAKELFRVLALDLGCNPKRGLWDE